MPQRLVAQRLLVFLFVMLPRNKRHFRPSSFCRLFLLAAPLAALNRGDGTAAEIPERGHVIQQPSALLFDTGEVSGLGASCPDVSLR